MTAIERWQQYLAAWQKEIEQSDVLGQRQTVVTPWLSRSDLKALAVVLKKAERK